MTQLVVRRPLDEPDVHDDLGPYPVHAQLRQPCGSRERRRGDLDRFETRAKVQQKPCVEARADFSAKSRSSPS